MQFLTKLMHVNIVLQLCTIIDGEAFVVHAGLSRYKGTCLSNIAAIERSKLKTTVKAAVNFAPLFHILESFRELLTKNLAIVRFS